MENMILIDLETRTFDVNTGGIYEVAAMVIENSQIKDKLHLGIVEDYSLINEGFGIGYEDISENEEIIAKFKTFINKYDYPLVAHNASFDRKFLIHFNWINEEYPFYDSIRAIKYKNPKLFSYSMSHLMDFMSLEEKQTHTALDDVEILYKIINHFQPDIWIPIGTRKSSTKNNTKFATEKKEFEVVKNLFAGKYIVFTGKGPYVRDILVDLAKKCGADSNSKNITKKTNLLVVGEDAGSKLQKALEKGIEIMSMNDFFEMTCDIKLDEAEKTTIKNIIMEPEVISNKLNGEVISLIPMKHGVAIKAAEIIEKHNGTPLLNLRQKETTLLVYQPYGEDLATVKKAKEKNIKTMTLGQFNKYILELEK